MNRIRLLAIGTVLVFALGTAAQQTTTSPDTHVAVIPSVEGHLKALSEKLDLTADQQAKARPILQEMHDGMQKLADNTSLTDEERMAGQKPIRAKADKAMRVFLTEEQKKKLDELEAEPHP